MKIRQLLNEAAGVTAAFAFGRFNPAHQGHVEVWKKVQESGVKWYIGTNPNTLGPNDPLTFEQKSAWMEQIYPAIRGHIAPEQSVVTLAAKIFKDLGGKEDATIAYITDETDWAWSGKLLNQYNGVEGKHGYYKFAQIVHIPSPRVSSATALRDAARADDKVAFYHASGTDPKLRVAGKTYFDTVKEACEKFPLPVKRTGTKEGVAEESVNIEQSLPSFNVFSNDDFETSFEVELTVDGKDVGFFAYQYFPETNDVENDAMINLNDFKGKGYGKMLLVKAIETAQNHHLPFKIDRNGITPAQRHVYKSLLNDRVIRIAPDKTITLTGQQGVAEETIHVGHRNSKGDWVKTSTHSNYSDAKNAMAELEKQGKKGVQHRYDNKGSIDPGTHNFRKVDEQGVNEGSNDDDLNDYYAGYYTDLLSQIENMSFTDRVDTKLGIKRSLESGELRLVDLKSEIRALDRELIRTKQGVTEGSREQFDPSTVWEVSFDYGPHQSDKVKVRASSQEEAEQKGIRAAKKLGHRFPQLNWAMPADEGVAEAGVTWHGTQSGSREAGLTDHTMDNAIEYLKANYPTVKKYNVRRAEYGFRVHDKPNEFRKSDAHIVGVNGAVDYLQLKRNSMMSGSEQISLSIGYSWSVYENPANGIAILYYQDRGMGNDEILLAGKTPQIQAQARQVFRDAGVLPTPKPKVKQQGVAEENVDEHIVKVDGGWELKSKHGNKNLGKYPTRAGAEKRERQVQYFKHMGEDAEQDVTEGDVIQFPKKHKNDLSSRDDCPKCGGDLQGGTYMGHKVKVCHPCKQVYLPPNTGIDTNGNRADPNDLKEFAPGGDFKPPVPPKSKGDDPWGNDDRSKIVQAVGQLLKSGKKVDWKVAGQMGHVVAVTDDGVRMKRWGKPRSKIQYFLPLTDDRDDKYQIKMKNPDYYVVVSTDSWQLESVEETQMYEEETFESIASYVRWADKNKQVKEDAPKGWEGTVKAMKKHKDIDNPYALANYMKNKGYKSHKKD